ncbi:MAG: hypothetical protein RIN56_20435 [Sporomusaceae bacterium]|nr:hypothetical protein [Sporomusaceae bacterium]
MSAGLSESRLASIVNGKLSQTASLSSYDKQVISQAIAAAIHENNKELEQRLNFIRNLTGK